MALTKRDWAQSFEKLEAELDSLLLQRVALGSEVSRVDKRIESVLQARVLLEELAGRKPSIPVAIVGETIADKIRYVLLRSETPLTAIEIKDRLAQLGFKFPGDPRPVATIHGILHSLTTARKPLIEVAPAKKNGRKAWQQCYLPRQ
jgi:hypothetical protein